MHDPVRCCKVSWLVGKAHGALCCCSRASHLSHGKGSGGRHLLLAWPQGCKANSPSPSFPWGAALHNALSLLLVCRQDCCPPGCMAPAGPPQALRVPVHPVPSRPALLWCGCNTTPSVPFPHSMSTPCPTPLTGTMEPPQRSHMLPLPPPTGRKCQPCSKATTLRGVLLTRVQACMNTRWRKPSRLYSYLSLAKNLSSPQESRLRGKAKASARLAAHLKNRATTLTNPNQLRHQVFTSGVC